MELSIFFCFGPLFSLLQTTQATKVLSVFSVFQELEIVMGIVMIVLAFAKSVTRPI